MPFYEVTYETGRTGVAEYQNDAEAQSALKAHNDRARTGKPGGPVADHPQGAAGVPDWPAERITAVRVYSKHPDDYNTEQTATKEVVLKEIEEQVERLADDNGVVNLQELANEVRGLSHPMVTERESSFDSIYKMANDLGDMPLGFLEDSE